MKLKTLCVVLRLTTILVMLPSAVRAADLERLVVRDLAAQELPHGKAAILTDLLISDLEETGRYRIYSRAEIQMVLDQIAFTQKFGKECDTDKCILEFGNAMGADRVLSGSVGQLGGVYVVTLTLYNIRTAEKEKRKTWKCACQDSELLSRIAQYGRELLGLVDVAAAPTPPSPAVIPPPATAASAGAQSQPPRPDATSATYKEPRTGIEFVRIPAGEFEMGSQDCGNDERPVHRVHLPEFWLAKTEVTVAQFRQFVKATSYITDAETRGSCWTQREDSIYFYLFENRSWVDARPSQTDNHPAACISWNDAMAFAEWAGLRLPTEAEWEYAARGGKAQQRWAGTDAASELANYAYYDGNTLAETAPVCRKKKNLFGLCDMAGNVQEWCADWYGADYYRESPRENPPGPAAGEVRVNRGGGVNDGANRTRSTCRGKREPDFRAAYLGFRLAFSGRSR